MAGRGTAGWLVMVGMICAVVAGVWLLRDKRNSPPQHERSEEAGFPAASNPPSVSPAPPMAVVTPPPAVVSVEVERLARRLLDTREPLAARRKMARELARLGTDDALQALRLAYVDAPPYLRAAIAEALGDCPHPEAPALLLDIVTGSDETAARGAVRGLATRGDAEAVAVLRNLLFDEKKSEALRTEAALALGVVQGAEALNALARALNEIRDEAVLENVLEGLGRRSLTETETILEDYLQRGDLPVELRVAAIEAVSDSPDDVGTFLMQFADDPNPEVRAAVGWALSAADEPGQVGPELLAWLGRETDATVRERLYQALANQEIADPAALLPVIERESNGDSRLAAYGFLAAAMQEADGTDVARFFETTAVPELRSAALTGELSQGLVAVMTLDRSGSPAALATLEEIAQRATNPRVREAAVQALRHRNTP